MKENPEHAIQIGRIIYCGAALGTFLFAALGGAAQSTPQRSLLALSKPNHTLAIVNPATLQVIARTPVGPDPHEVIASSDGRMAYVSIYGGGRYHALSVIDLIAQKALPDIDTGALNGPHGLAFVGGKVWFTAEGAKAIARYDPITARVDWIMGTGQNRTHMMYVTADEKQIYTTNVSSATVSILEQVALPPMGAATLGVSTNAGVAAKAELKMSLLCGWTPVFAQTYGWDSVALLSYGAEES